MQKQYMPNDFHFKNEKLFLLDSQNKYFHIKHDLKITHMTSLGTVLCFANENNEIFKATSIRIDNISKGIIPSKIKIKFFISGYDDIYVVLENNKIFSARVPQSFKEVTITTIKNITHACCGTYCGIFVDNYKVIHTIGKITSTSEINSTKPFTFNYGTIKNISCGYGHLIVLNSNGEIYGLGTNEYGQLTPSKVDINSLVKICPNFIKDSIIVDAFALPLSHLTVIVTNKNDIFIYGYVNQRLERCFKNDINYNENIFKLRHLCFKKDEDELNCETAYKISELNNTIVEDDFKFNYEKKEISIFGGFTTMAFVNNIKNKIWLGRRGDHFVNEYIYLKKIDSSFKGNECVINMGIGADVVGILVADCCFMNIYMENNLKMLSSICCGKIILESDSIDSIPLFDISIKF